MTENEARISTDLAQMIATASTPVGGVLRFFAFSHLPPALRTMSARFAELACDVAACSSNPETAVALRKLLEAKDAAVRSLLP